MDAVTSAGASAEQPVVLRPLSLGEILDLAISLYRKNFLVLVGIVALITVPLTIIQLALTILGLSPSTQFLNSSPSSAGTSLAGYTPWLLFYGGLILTSLLSAIANALQQGALTTVVSERYFGHAITFKQAYMRTLGRWPHLLIALFLIGLVDILAIVLPTGTSMILAFVPILGTIVSLCICFLYLPLLLLIIFLNTQWALSTQAIVLEGANGPRGMGRSWRLVQGSFWRVLLTIGALFLLTLFLTWVPTYTIIFGLARLWASSLILSQVIPGIVSMLVSVAIQPLQSAVMTVLYYDLRIRREGLDLQMAMQQLGPVPANPALEGNV